MRRQGEPLPRVLLPDKKSCVFFTISGLGDQKTGNNLDSSTSNYFRIEVFILFYFILFLFLYHNIFVVKVQEIAWSVSYGENKTQNPKRTNKGNIRNNSLQLGSIPVPGPQTGVKLKQVKQRKPSSNQRIVKYKLCKPSSPETS